MKKCMFILALVAIILCVPSGVGATGSQVADVSPATLAPSQRDINIAVLAVILGSILVGYERTSRERKAHTHKATHSSEGDENERAKHGKLPPLMKPPPPPERMAAQRAHSHTRHQGHVLQ